MIRYSKRIALWAASLTLFLTLAGSLRAADFNVYTDKTAFLAAVDQAYYTETFNSLVTNQVLVSPITLNSGPNQFVASASLNFYNVDGPTTGDVWLSTNNADDPITFSSFATQPTAIGGNFFLTDFTGTPTVGTIRAVLNAGSADYSTSVSSSTNFIGFVSVNNTPITSLKLSTVGGNATQFVTANNLIIATALPVPEPSTYLLGALASTVLAAVARRRKSKIQA